MAEERRLLEVLSDITKERGYDENRIDMKAFSSDGANYTSKLYSIVVPSPEKDLKLFAKVAVLGEKVRSISEIQLYDVEITFYTKILTKFRELERKYNIAEPNRLVVPKYYAGVTKYNEELMILEDLTSLGYYSLNRRECFDWNYASTCINALANFHATSVAFEREYPKEYAETVGKFKYNPLKHSMKDFLDQSVEIAIKVTDDIYRKRLDVFLQGELRRESYKKFFDSDRKVILVHGDFRPSNIFQKIDKGTLQVALIDYQMIRAGNPVMDLLYFLISGSDEQFRAKHWNQAFDYYYYSFRRALHRLGIDPDSVLKEQDYRDDVKEMLPFGLTLATYLLLFITVDEDDAPRPEDGVDFDRCDLKPSEQFHVRFNSLVRDYVAMEIL